MRRGLTLFPMVLILALSACSSDDDGGVPTGSGGAGSGGAPGTGGAGGTGGVAGFGGSAGMAGTGGGAGSAGSGCERSGSGTARGTVRRVTLEPVGLVGWGNIARIGTFVVLYEKPGTCDVRPETSERLILRFPCGAPNPGTYDVVESPTAPCSNAASAVLRQVDGSDVATATQGTINVTEFGTCLVGSFDLTFGSESLSGTFNAVGCGSFVP